MTITLLAILAAGTAIGVTGPARDVRNLESLWKPQSRRPCNSPSKPAPTGATRSHRTCPPLPLPPTTPTSTTTRKPGRKANAIGVASFQFVDQSRFIYPPHSPTGAPEPRIIETYVWYPAVSAHAGSTESPGVPFAKRDTAGYGPSLVNHLPRAFGTRELPLVVFSHGYDVWPWEYQPLLDAWVRAGFVVATPVFPLTNPAAPGGLYENDMVNQPQDVSFVLGRLLSLDAQPDNILSGLIDPDEIGLAGHSDGGDTTVAATYDSCCAIGAVKAAAVLSGEELETGTGSYFTTPGPPLLVVQGTFDTINPPSDSQRIYDAATGTKYDLQLGGAGHYSPYMHRDQFEMVTAEVTTAFFEAELEGNQSALEKLTSPGALPSFATLQGLAQPAPPAPTTLSTAPASVGLSSHP